MVRRRRLRVRPVLRLAVLTCAAGAPASAAGAPSFDCVRAAVAVERMVCEDAELSALDRELARLYRLASEGPGSGAAGRTALVAAERGWIGRRDRCEASEAPRTCVKAAYVGRIAELRENDVGAPAATPAGISLGPFAADCPCLGAALTVVFVNSDPGAVFLTWGDRSAVLDRARSASGARYAATKAEGDYLFWNKGSEASFAAPGVAGTLTCALGEPG